jgi:uncharacterized membrane protein YfcA
LEHLPLLIIAGLIAGLIDSIAGGGGLITLPVLSLHLESIPHAIGTNKIVGATGALVALLVYARRSGFKWRSALEFSLWVGLGSTLGSLTTPHLSNAFFTPLLLISAPLLLILIFKKDFWILKPIDHALESTKTRSLFTTPLLGIAIGFYDGFFGPGGGTLMFLGLFLVLRKPLLEALTISKFVNFVSAFVSLISYSSQGQVHPLEGISLAIPMAFGAYFGAGLASKHAQKIVRPALTIVVFLLLIKLTLTL